MCTAEPSTIAARRCLFDAVLCYCDVPEGRSRMRVRKLRVPFLRVVFVPIVFVAIFVRSPWSLDSPVAFGVEFIGYVFLLAGLALVSRIAEALGGRIIAEIEQGGIFTIKLVFPCRPVQETC